MRELKKFKPRNRAVESEDYYSFLTPATQREFMREFARQQSEMINLNREMVWFGDHKKIQEAVDRQLEAMREHTE